MIYFVQRADGLIKIGTSANFYVRLGQLEREYGELVVLAWTEGDAEREKQLHIQFSVYNVINEWFFASDALRDFIREKAYKGLPPRPPTDLTVDQLFQLLTEAQHRIDTLIIENNSNIQIGLRSIELSQELQLKMESLSKANLALKARNMQLEIQITNLLHDDTVLKLNKPMTREQIVVAALKANAESVKSKKTA